MVVPSPFTPALRMIQLGTAVIPAISVSNTA
jgi:hypothetical protein